jgi:hypothetical protein
MFKKIMKLFEKKEKGTTFDLVVIGSGDTSVGMFPSFERVTICFPDTKPEHLPDNFLETLKDFLGDVLENGRTEVIEWKKYLEDTEQDGL